MLKTLGAQIKEFKKDSIKTPLFMILEVLMEMLIPFSWHPSSMMVWRKEIYAISVS